MTARWSRPAQPDARRPGVRAAVSAVVVRPVRRARPATARERLERRARSRCSGSPSPARRGRPVRALRAAGSVAPAPRQRQAILVTYGLVAVTVAQFCYFSAVQLHAGRRPPCSSSSPRRQRSSSGCGCATASGPARSPSSAPAIAARRAGAGPRPGVRGRRSASPASCGRSRRWSAPRRTSSLRRRPPTACRRWPWRPGGFVVAAVALGLLGLVGLLPMATAAAPVTYAGATLPPWIVAGAARRGDRRAALHRRHRRRVGGWARGWRRSWRSARSSPACVWAVVLLDELPRPVQLLGGRADPGRGRRA